jgi:hypothetical protein
VQEEILSKNGNADLEVYAIWFRMYPTDRPETWPADVLTDRRVRHYWDEEKSVGTWYGQRLNEMESALAPGSVGYRAPVLWDAYLVYGPESRWEDAPTGLRRWGRTILRTKESLLNSITDLWSGSNK